MPKANKLDDALRMAKQFEYFNDSKEIRTKSIQKSNYIAGKRNLLYQEGYNYGLSGYMLDDATDIVDDNGIETPKKDNRSFKNGYLAGINQLGFNKGLAGFRVDELAMQFPYQAEFDDFITGYTKGMEYKAKLDSQGKSRR